MHERHSNRPRRDWGALALGVGFALYAAAGLLPALNPALSPWFIARFHLRTDSFLSWAALQPAGWMYNFENRVLSSPRPLRAGELQQPPDGLVWAPINHQTARAITCYEGRIRYMREAGTRYVYLQGRYRQHQVTTAYRVHVPSALGEGRAPVRVDLADGAVALEARP